MTAREPPAAIEGGGISRSDPVPQPTTTADAVSDLHALLGALTIAEPVVLVGHSYGGVVSRLYASTYPADVAGMVLVDSLTPELRANMTAQEWEIWNVLNERTPEQIADYPDLERHRRRAEPSISSPMRRRSSRCRSS